MLQVAGKIRVLEGYRPESLPLQELLSGGEPAVLKGLVDQWELVRAGRNSDQHAMDYLRSHYNGRPVRYSYGEPQIAGRPFYSDDFTQLNCIVRQGRLDEVLNEIHGHLRDERPPTYYVASLLVDGHLPGLRAKNNLDLAAHGVDAPPSIWIGNRTIASCHYDAPNNLACCAIGQTPLHAVSAGADLQSLSRAARAHAGRTSRQRRRFRESRLREAIRVFAKRLPRGRWPRWNPATRCSSPAMWWHHVEGLSRVQYARELLVEHSRRSSFPRR